MTQIAAAADRFVPIVDHPRFIAACNDADNLHALLHTLQDLYEAKDSGSRTYRVICMAAKLAEKISITINDAQCDGHLGEAA